MAQVQDYILRGQVPVSTIFNMETRLVACMLLITMATATYVDVSSMVLHEVSPYFLSFTTDDTVFEPSVGWGAFNFSCPRVQTLLSGLSPAIWRVGGSPADYLLFDVPQDKLNMSAAHATPLITMTKSDWDNMVHLSRKAGVRLLFDLDLELRVGAHWDLQNAMNLMDYSVSQGYGDNIDWELGNEPNAYHGPDQTVLSEKQIGEDFITLAKLIRSYPAFSKSRIVGPDVEGDAGTALDILKGYLKEAGSYVDALTVHQYYFRGDVAKWTDYINPKYFLSLEKFLLIANNLIRNSSYPTMPLWIGETSDAWHSGTAHVSDRYVSAFLWLDKLGVSARYGVDVVMRQTFWSHNYGLINDSMLPNPDYWLSLAHKRLVGARVLDLETRSRPDTTRIYAQCASQNSYKQGAVTVFMLNVDVNDTDHITFSDDLIQNSPMMDVFLITPADGHSLLSQTVALNGHILEMLDDYTLPKLLPLTLPASKGFDLPPLTYAFIVFPDAQEKSCQ